MPNFIKAMSDQEKAKELRNNQRRKYYRKTAGYKPRSWTIHEQELLFNSNLTDPQLSALIHRSVAAIQIQRSKLKRSTH